MAFCCKDKQLVGDSYTVLENKFILNYMPDAPEGVVRVYLLGLALCDQHDNVNTVAHVAQKLGITEQDVVAAYDYWEELGLVQVIASNPPQVVYLPISDNSVRTVSSTKYSKFSKEIQRVVTGRMISTNEYNAYYNFLEKYEGFSWEALIAVAKYCVDYKGNNINYPYILTVAKAQYQKGNLTAQMVVDGTTANLKHEADLQLLMHDLKAKRVIDYFDRELYEKWTNHLGFSRDTITQVVKQFRIRDMKKLDSILTEFFKVGTFDIKEIISYMNNKQMLFDLAKEVTKKLGVYYQSLDVVVDEYVSKWIQLGFDADTVTMLAKYCFRNNVRTLSGLDNTVEKFYKMGLTRQESIDQYMQTVVANDKTIKALLEKAGLLRNVTASDRKLYKTWTESWLLPTELIEFAVEKSISASNPLQYANKVLASYKEQGITTVAQAQTAATVATTCTKDAPTKHSFEQHEYTDDEINALFTDLESLEI